MADELKGTTWQVHYVGEKPAGAVCDLTGMTQEQKDRLRLTLYTLDIDISPEAKEFRAFAGEIEILKQAGAEVVMTKSVSKERPQPAIPMHKQDHALEVGVGGVDPSATKPAFIRFVSKTLSAPSANKPPVIRITPKKPSAGTNAPSVNPLRDSHWVMEEPPFTAPTDAFLLYADALRGGEEEKIMTALASNQIPYEITSTLLGTIDGSERPVIRVSGASFVEVLKNNFANLNAANIPPIPYDPGADAAVSAGKTLVRSGATNPLHAEGLASASNAPRGSGKGRGGIG